MEQLLTKKDLAQRWQLSMSAINDYIADGIITPIKNIPSVRFSPKHIAELEGVKLEKHSPLEWRRLEKELEFWKTKAEKMEETFNKLDMVITETRYLKQKEA